MLSAPPLTPTAHEPGGATAASRVTGEITSRMLQKKPPESSGGSKRCLVPDAFWDSRLPGEVSAPPIQQGQTSQTEQSDAGRLGNRGAVQGNVVEPPVAGAVVVVATGGRPIIRAATGVTGRISGVIGVTQSRAHRNQLNREIRVVCRAGRETGQADRDIRRGAGIEDASSRDHVIAAEVGPGNARISHAGRIQTAGRIRSLIAGVIESSTDGVVEGI